MARQLIAHGHFVVNNKNVNIPSYLVKVGDMVSLKERSRKNEGIQASLATASGRGIPPWLVQEADNFRGTITALPARADIPLPVSEQLIVELYSK
jgi:small subunit ribosomal protein S4